MVDFIIWFYASFFVRMVIIFTVMMKYYHFKNGKVGVIFKGFAGIFFVLDIVYDYMLTPVMLDLPATVDETVSHRCNRYIDSGNAWQKGFAKIMRAILNFSDPGHIKNG
jgi:hypothetical protein